MIIILGFALSGCNPETNTFAITYTISEGGSISGDLHQTVEKGKNGTSVTAIADDDYIFIGWSDGYQHETRQEINVNSNINVCANFEKKKTPSSQKLNEPTNIRIEGDILKWNAIFEASGYMIDIDGNMHEIDIEEFSLSSLPKSSVYFIKIMAKGNGTTYTDSEYSEVLKYFAETSMNLKYASINNGEAYEVFRGTEENTDLVIAEYYNGKPVVSIGERAFEGFDVLKRVTIPNAVKNIKDWAFAKCNGLLNIDIPQSVEEIGNYAFANCSGLKSLFVPNSTKNIGEGAFIYCAGLQEITLGTGLTEINDWIFGECISLKKFEIPSNIKIIGKYAFFNCKELTEISLGVGVTDIKEGAFSLCSGLLNITISAVVKYIGYYAFGGCENITIIVQGYESTPDGWDKEWNFDNCRVIWGN